MDLKNKSYWQAGLSNTDYPRLEGEVEVDVAIIGAGITGLTAAYFLKRAGKRVAVIDQHRLALAESGHTTAHLTAVLDTRYDQIIKDFGLDIARQVCRSKREAINDIEVICHELNSDCDFKRVPGFLFATKTGHVAALKLELEALASVGLAPSWCDSAPLPFKNEGAVRIENQASFHPAKYFQSLAKVIHANGSFVFEQSPVEDISEGESCRLATSQGNVKARVVIMATHTPSFNRMILHTKIAAYRTYAVAAKLARPPEFDALYWDMEDPYHYIRSHGAHWIIGGEDHKTGMKKETGKCYEVLENYISQNFGSAQIDFRWSGQVLEPVDGLPYIGKNPGSAHTYVATGYSGNGLTFGTLAGRMISDSILGRVNPYEKIYAPSRITPRASFQEYLKENKDFPLCILKDVISPAETDSIDAIKAGEGKILRHKGQKVAVFKDEKNKLHAVSSLCPHLGCHVHFNAAEKSWDCPCHGSRFDVDGGLLNGPSTRGLSRIDLTE